jgi:1-acyl-sn-glycerol-3-phosphate acyltransferase
MYKKLVAGFFTWYIRRIIGSDFSALNYNRIDFDQSRSILILANHFSWWDGFMIFRLNKLLFKKNFHVMVTEENYQKVSFLKYLGAFPVKRNSRSMVQSLEKAGHLLNDSNNLVLIFPQGKLFSNHVDAVAFERGFLNLINSSERKFQYVFSAAFVDYFEKRKPCYTCYLKKWDGDEFISLQLIVSAYNDHYQSSIQKHCHITV